MNANKMDIGVSRIAQVALPGDEYGEELMCTGWNPQLNLAGVESTAPLNRHINLLADMAGMDVDTFMKRLYECQS